MGANRLLITQAQLKRLGSLGQIAIWGNGGTAFVVVEAFLKVTVKNSGTATSLVSQPRTKISRPRSWGRPESLSGRGARWTMDRGALPLFPSPPQSKTETYVSTPSRPLPPWPSSLP